MSSRTTGELSGSIYASLKVRLLDGEFPAGKRLSMRQLTEEFQTSKQPVTEAFRMLAADGLVTIVPRVGCLPNNFSQQESIDFFRVFALFEASLTSLAAQRRSAEQLEELRALMAEEEKIAHLDDGSERSQQYRRANRLIHGKIHQMAGSALVSVQSTRLWDISDYIINSSHHRGEFRKAVDDRHEDHERIFLALQQGDATLAHEEMHRHIMATADLLGLTQEN